MLFLFLCCSVGRSFEQISFPARPWFLFTKITLIQPNVSVRKVYVLIIFSSDFFSYSMCSTGLFYLFLHSI